MKPPFGSTSEFIAKFFLNTVQTQALICTRIHSPVRISLISHNYKRFQFRYKDLEVEERGKGGEPPVPCLA